MDHGRKETIGRTDGETRGCSPEKEVGGRLKQDLDKDFKTI